MTGHPEYDLFTLDAEYRRDLEKGLEISVPENYYPSDDPAQRPINRWRSHAHLLYHNWLNYYVYQTTPYDLEELSPLPASRAELKSSVSPVVNTYDDFPGL